MNDSTALNDSKCESVHYFIHSATITVNCVHLPTWINICRYSFGFRKAAPLQRQDREPEGMESAVASASFAVIQTVFKAMPHNSWLVFAFSCDWQVHTSTVNFNLNGRRLRLHHTLHHQKYLTWGGGYRLQKSRLLFLTPSKKELCKGIDLCFRRCILYPQCQSPLDFISVFFKIQAINYYLLWTASKL